MPTPRRRVRRESSVEVAAVPLLAVVAAVAAALAGCHPTGTPVVDPIYAALLAGTLVLAAGRASRGAILWLGVVTAALCRSWLLVPGVCVLVLAFAGTGLRERKPALSALTAALAVNVVLRWPTVGFQGATALVAAAALGPILVSGARALSRRARRWAAVAALGVGTAVVVLVVPVAVAALLSRHQIQQGVSAADAALRRLSDGDTASAQQELRSASADFTVSSARLGAWWTAGARLVPVAAQQRQGLSTAAAVADTVSTFTGSQMSRLDYSRFRYQQGGIDLSQVQSVGQPLAAMDALYRRETTRLSRSTSGWQVPPLADNVAKLRRDLDRAVSATGTARLAVERAPSLLGANGPRRYFVAFLDPAESRGLGGLLVWYGVLTANDGHLKLSSDGEALKVGEELASAGGGHVTGLAEYMARYGRFGPQDSFIDAPYSPDLPTDTQVVSQLFGQAGGGPIDGMLVLDPASLQTLVSVTGPLEVPGLGRLTGTNTADVLLRSQYTLYPGPGERSTREGALDAALHDAAERVSGGSLPGIRPLVQALGADVKRGDLLFWSVHPQDSRLLDATGLAGAFPSRDGGDLLSVVTQNAANNKLDAYLKSSVTDHVVYDPGTGRVDATVDVLLRNTASSTGLPAEVVGSYNGSGLPQGTDLLWTTLYSPLRLSSVTVGGVAGSFPASAEFGVEAYSGYVKVPAGASVLSVFHLTGRVRPGGYRLTVHDQPMAIGGTTAVVVARSGLKSGTGATWDPTGDLNAFRLFRFGS